MNYNSTDYNRAYARRYYEENRNTISNRRRQARDNARNRARDFNEHQYLGECVHDQTLPLDIGQLSVECANCSALSFRSEHGRIKHNCCHHGKIKLNLPPEYPNILKELFQGNSSDALHFRRNVRYYNSAFAMAAFCPTEEIQFRGVSCLRIRGEVSAMATTSILPPTERRPRFAQIYMYENNDALTYRASENCRQSVLHIIQTVMNCNPYAQSYRKLFDYYNDNPSENVRLEFYKSVTSDQRRYNLPTSSASKEVAAIIVTGADGNIPNDVEFIAYPKHNYQCQKMYKLSHHVEPMLFPLLFPQGQPGYSINIQNNIASHRRVTAVQYFGWQLRVTNQFNVFTMAGKLTQQYIIHGYITNEWNRLNYIRTHQQQFRRESMQGLLDHVENSSANTSNALRLGRVVVLPSSFEGSPRSMQQHFQDAMALSREIGRPDLFITFTANPQWPEIRDYLRTLPSGYTASDIPHVVVRAFYVRFDAFIKQIAEGSVFGKILGYTFNIEFQKRGLPHAHCLFIISPRDKLLTPEAIDRFISAEIPDKNNFPNLHAKVMKHMLHGPHSESTPCYDKSTDVCTKRFPHAFCDQTDMTGNGFPQYMRRDNRNEMNVYNKRVDNKLVPVDNSMVVPYNPYLLLTYDCHINVEYCGSVMAYKYIFKYVNKGHDRIKVIVKDGVSETALNEVDNYIDTRYVSSMEAAWRLLELPVHDKSHSVIRLPVHLPGNQQVTFQEGRELEAINSQNTVTQLMAFFQLNNEDPDARQYKYVDIPKHYTWVQKDRKWKKRQREAEKIIVRLYAVSPRDSERFFLKYLLQCIPGPSSFNNLKTVEGVEYRTFKEAAYQLGFGENDKQLEEILDEASHHMTPKTLRIFFAYLLLTCDHINAEYLWDKFKNHMCQDQELNTCLQDIEYRLSSEDRTLSDFGLPSLQNQIMNNLSNNELSLSEHWLIADGMISQLNVEQRAVFDYIIQSLNQNNMTKLFFIDGPGGTGKTFLYRCLYHYQIYQKRNVLCVAWTGIAAILLPNGRTSHRVFKLPINLPSSTEQLNPLYLDKHTKKVLVETDLIIWDEASMIPAVALTLIDITLRDLLKSNLPFGGKCILFGGDFRQVLPVIKRAGKNQIMNGTIKSLPFWKSVKHFFLTQNMRADEQLFSEWLLNIGNGVVDCVTVSDILCENLITETFGSQITEESLSNCILLAPRNNQVNMLNELVLNNIAGEVVECVGYDTATSPDGDATDDESMILRFQPEYLAKFCITGLPLHTLKLKIGAVVMLVRNLCIADGLCNGTRLVVRKITKNVLYCTILTGFRAGNTACIPRIKLNTKDNRDLPFVLHRTQFPVRLAFAMTINKAQGQTFKKVGLYIDQNSPIFGHGQLYVALSRCQSKSGIKIKIVGAKNDSEKISINNIVYKEIL